MYTRSRSITLKVAASVHPHLAPWIGTGYKRLVADLSDISENVSKLQQLLAQPQPLTDEDLQKLRSLVSVSLYLGPNQLQVAELRATVELLDSIRRFDKASGQLVVTTNLLTKRIYWLTILAVILACCGIVASAWPYLTWWITHGLRFS